jgi:hypothetical protein
MPSSGDTMHDVAKVQHLTVLIMRLRDHVERCGSSPRFEEELTKAQNALDEIEARKQQPQ